MISILSLVTSVKDYVEIVHKLIESDSNFKLAGQINYNDLGPIITYTLVTLKEFIFSAAELNWLKNIWSGSLPIIIPDISSAMISEISVLDGFFHNAFNFLDTPLSYSPEVNIILYSFEKFTIGLINSLFLFLPTGTSHLITLRRFVMQGLEAGYLSGLGSICGNILWITSVIFGCRFFVIPWLSLDIFRYLLGFVILVKYMWDSYNERKIIAASSPPLFLLPTVGDTPYGKPLASDSVASRTGLGKGTLFQEKGTLTIAKQKIFFLNFLLALTEQTSIYPFISNISIGSDSSILESFPAQSLPEFLLIHGSYIIGLTVGCLSLLHFSCWFWENPAFKIYIWVMSTPLFKLGNTSFYYKTLNFTFLYLTMICAISSIPYYGLDYTLTNPLGFVQDDRILDQKTNILPKEFLSFLNSKASDRNTRRNRGRHGRRERWKRRIRKYRTFDASLYDQGVYDLFTIEDLNYGFDRFWLRRKMRNHRVRFRFFPGPWMRSFKKQLAKPRLESYAGPRQEFFRLLFEQVYHPSFHEYKTAISSLPFFSPSSFLRKYRTDTEKGEGNPPGFLAYPSEAEQAAEPNPLGFSKGQTRPNNTAALSISEGTQKLSWTDKKTILPSLNSEMLPDNKEKSFGFSSTFGSTSVGRRETQENNNWNNTSNIVLKNNILSTSILLPIFKPSGFFEETSLYYTNLTTIIPKVNIKENLKLENSTLRKFIRKINYRIKSAEIKSILNSKRVFASLFLLPQTKQSGSLTFSRDSQPDHFFWRDSNSNSNIVRSSETSEKNIQLKRWKQIFSKMPFVEPGGFIYGNINSPKNIGDSVAASRPLEVIPKVEERIPLKNPEGSVRLRTQENPEGLLLAIPSVRIPSVVGEEANGTQGRDFVQRTRRVSDFGTKRTEPREGRDESWLDNKENGRLKGFLKNFYKTSLTDYNDKLQKKQNSKLNISLHDKQILKYRAMAFGISPKKLMSHENPPGSSNSSPLLLPSPTVGNPSGFLAYPSEADLLPSVQKAAEPKKVKKYRIRREPSGFFKGVSFRNEKKNKTTFYTNTVTSFSNPLKFYLQKQQAFERKLRYYTPTIFRKFSIENNAPYFRVMMKRYFYYYKPTLRWEKTMKVASLRKARRKTQANPRKIQLTRLQTELNAPLQIELNAKVSKSEVYDRQIKSTHNYTIVGKRANRYRYQIYKDVLQHWYYSPFNRLLLKFDIDLFIKRQPNSHFLTKNEENLLHLRRFLLSKHYNTLRWYTYMQHYRSMKTKIGGTKSFASGVYNQQFTGTFKKIRHLFAITPSQSNQTVLKFDQPLYNETYNNSINNYQKQLIIHEELYNSFPSSPSSCYSVGSNRYENPEGYPPGSFATYLEQSTDTEGRNAYKPKANLLKQQSKIFPLNNNAPSDSDNNATSVLAIPSVGNPPGSSKEANENPEGLSTVNIVNNEQKQNNIRLGKDLLNQSNQIIKNYLINTNPIKKEYIKNLIEQKNYLELTNFLYKGKKTRGFKPITNQKSMLFQEKEYLLTNSEKEELRDLEKLKLASAIRPLQQDLWINLLKKWKRKVNDQEFLKNYLQRRVEKREKRKRKKERNLKTKLQRLEMILPLKTVYQNLTPPFVESGGFLKGAIFYKDKKFKTILDPSLQSQSKAVSTGVQKALIEGTTNYLRKNISVSERIDLKQKFNWESFLDLKLNKLGHIKAQTNKLKINTLIWNKPSGFSLRSNRNEAAEPSLLTVTSTYGTSNRFASDSDPVRTQNNFSIKKTSLKNLKDLALLNKSKELQNSLNNLSMILKLNNLSISSVPYGIRREGHTTIIKKEEIRLRSIQLSKLNKIKMLFQKYKLNQSKFITTKFIKLFYPSLKRQSIKFRYLNPPGSSSYGKKPLYNKGELRSSLKNWQQKERALNKQKRARKEFKVFSKKPFKNNNNNYLKFFSPSTKWLATSGSLSLPLASSFRIPSVLAIPSVGEEANPSKNPEGFRRKGSFSYRKQTTVGNESKGKANQKIGTVRSPLNINAESEPNRKKQAYASEIAAIIKKTYTKFFTKKFKRKKSPQRRARIRRNRGVTKKRTLSDSLKRELRNLRRYNVSAGEAERSENSREALETAKQKIYLNFNFGINQSKPAEITVTDPPGSSLPSVRYVNPKGFLFSLRSKRKEVRDKFISYKSTGEEWKSPLQKRSKQKKQRFWKQKRSKYSQKLRKYRKRRRSVLGKVRILNKQLKLRKSATDLKNWWWKNFLPNLRAMNDSLWQYEKDRQVQQKLLELSIPEILERNQTINNKPSEFSSYQIPTVVFLEQPKTNPPGSSKEEESNLLQIGDFDYKPLALPEAIRLRNEAKDNQVFLNQEPNFANKINPPGSLRISSDSKNKVLPTLRVYNSNKDNNVNNSNDIISLLTISQNNLSTMSGTTEGRELSKNPLKNPEGFRRKGSSNEVKQIVPILNSPIPFYAGWDESLRKFVVTNRLLSRRESGYEINMPVYSPFQKALNLFPSVLLPSYGSTVPKEFVPKQEGDRSLGFASSFVPNTFLHLYQIGSNTEGSTQRGLLSSYRIPTVERFQSEAEEKNKKLEFTAAPLKGMNAATTLYWQIPFTTYDPDQFFVLGMDGFAPIGWRRFQFRHSILKSWLYEKTTPHNDSILSSFDKSEENQSKLIVKNKINIKSSLPTEEGRALGTNPPGFLAYPSVAFSTFGIPKEGSTVPNPPGSSNQKGKQADLSLSSKATETKQSYKKIDFLENQKEIESFVKLKNTSQLKNNLSLIYKLKEKNATSWHSQKPNNLAQKNTKNIYRRLKKRYRRVKKHPRSPVWFPSGPLLNQVLPVHYIYIFYKRSRLPRDRYIKRRLRKSKAPIALLPNNTNSNPPGSSNESYKIVSINKPSGFSEQMAEIRRSATDFTLRKRIKTKRKYHIKQKLSKKTPIIPRRMKFLGSAEVVRDQFGAFPSDLEADLLPSVSYRKQIPSVSIVPKQRKEEPFPSGSEAKQPQSYNKEPVRWRPLSRQKLNKPIAELIKEQRTLKNKQRKKELQDANNKQPTNLRIKQLRRRVQRQIIRSVWRYKPRSGGFVWPGDYLKLELVKAPKLNIKSSTVRTLSSLKQIPTVFGTKSSKANPEGSETIQKEIRNSWSPNKIKRKKKRNIQEWQVQPKKYLLQKHNYNVIKKKLEKAHRSYKPIRERVKELNLTFL